MICVIDSACASSLSVLRVVVDKIAIGGVESMITGTIILSVQIIIITMYLVCRTRISSSNFARNPQCRRNHPFKCETNETGPACTNDSTGMYVALWKIPVFSKAQSVNSHSIEAGAGMLIEEGYFFVVIGGR